MVELERFLKMVHDIIVYDLISSISYMTRFNKTKLKSYEYFLESCDNMILDKMYKLYYSPIRDDDMVYEFEKGLGKIFFKAP